MRRDAILALTMFSVFSGAALGQEETPFRSIAVSGTVETKTAPDQIVWSIRLSDRDRDMRQAKARNDEKAKSVVALREKLGVAEGDFETGPVNIIREYERDRYGQQGDFKHFAVSRSVTIRQRDLKRFDEFLDTLVASSEMEVNFTFESSRMHEVRAETRLKALEAAKDKAAAMANVVEAKLGRVLTINEHAQGGRWQSQFSNAAVIQNTPPADLATERFVPGAISVRVTVYATFELE